MTDNDVVVRLLVRDDGSVELKRFQSQVAATKAEVAGLGGAGSSLGNLFDSLDGKTGNLSNQMLGLNRSLASASGTLRHDLLYGVRDLTLGLTAAAGAATYFGLKAVDSFQHTQAAFSVLTGSMQNGKALYNQLMAFNLKSPFDMQPLASSEQTLLGFGIGQKASVADLKAISNVAAVQQDPNEALSRMALAIGQINQSGVVRGQDLNQLVQAGFPAYGLLSQISGGSVQQLRKQMASGNGMDPSKFLAALADPNNPELSKYGGAAKAMNQTISGQLSNLTTEVRQTAINAFHPMADELIKEMPQLTKTLQGMTKELAPDIASFGMDIIKGAEHILPILTPIVHSLLQGMDGLMQAGGPFLRELQNVDPQVTSALDDFFTTLAGEEPELAGIFGDLLQVLPLFITDLGDLLVLADPLLKMLDTFLGFRPVQGIMADLLVGLLAYKTLAGPIEMLMKFGTALRGAAGAETALAAAEVRKKEADALPDVQGPTGGGPAGSGGSALSRLALTGIGARELFAMGLAGSQPDVRNPGSYDIAGGSAHGGLTLFGTPPTTLAGQEALFHQYKGNSAALQDLAIKFPSAARALGMSGSGGLGITPALVAAAIHSDPRLGRVVGKTGSTVNVHDGAITIQVSDSKNPTETAQFIRQELNKWIEEQQDR
jgi:tape measure domain-containing protein